MAGSKAGHDEGKRNVQLNSTRMGRQPRCAASRKPQWENAVSLDIVFMGTPEFSVPTLAALIDAGHRIVAVYTQPPRPAGRRGLADTPSPVHAFAAARDLEVRTPASLKSAEEQERFAALRADVAVVVAYGLLLPRPILAAPRLGCINLHGSLLPRWRGAAPIQRAIMAGDAETGVMTMQMEAGLDTGPVLATARTAIRADETEGELRARLSALGGPLMVETLDRLAAGTLQAVPQAAEGVSYAAKIDKAEARIDFSRPAAEVHNLIRGLSPFPGAWLEISVDGKPERLKVLRSTFGAGSGTPGEVLDDHLTIACGTGAVRLLVVQRAGKRAVPADEFLRGLPLRRGERVG
jgi:methionyl-tRNA formyltransferase